MKSKRLKELEKNHVGKVSVDLALKMATEFDPMKPMPVYALALRALAGRVNLQKAVLIKNG